MTLALTDARLFPAVAAINADLGSESLSASSQLDLTVRTSLLTVSGTMAFTLTDGTYLGQRKRVQCVSAASTPLGVLTINSPETASGLVCAGTFTFAAVGQAVDFLWTGSKWRAERVQRAGTIAPVVGTTVLTGLNLYAQYALSVTGTVSSTTTKGIPDGSAVGEQIQVGCSVAASTPSGTIAISGLTTLGAAATTLGTFSATTSYAGLVWTGGGWMATGNASVVLS